MKNLGFRQKLMGTIVGILLVTAFLGFAVPQAIADEAKPVVYWGYGGTHNPTVWGDISKDFQLCEVGRDQSPIDLHGAVVPLKGDIEFNYQSVPLNIVNNGHTIQVNYAPGSTATIDGKVYNLLQFHFHTPSEHTILGQAAAMEMHLVHKNEKGELAVIGVLMNEGKAQSLIDTIWANILEKDQSITSPKIMINVADILPKSHAHFSYSGSLTTPPCSEGVNWNVLTEPITLSEEQIEAFQALYPVNARPIQPTNGRLIQSR